MWCVERTPKFASKNLPLSCTHCSQWSSKGRSMVEAPHSETEDDERWVPTERTLREDAHGVAMDDSPSSCSPA